jgi:2-polyprenyl-6-methoxyphenol hydroxylase-like FAD-dependent oxidoreductase
VTTRVAVLGAGSWGTAFAMILADAGCQVTLWGRRPELIDAITTSGTNPEYFPGGAGTGAARQPHQLDTADRPGHRPGQPDEGGRAGAGGFTAVPSPTLTAAAG